MQTPHYTNWEDEGLICGECGTRRPRYRAKRPEPGQDKGASLFDGKGEK